MCAGEFGRIRPHLPVPSPPWTAAPLQVRGTPFVGWCFTPFPPSSPPPRGHRTRPQISTGPPPPPLRILDRACLARGSYHEVIEALGRSRPQCRCIGINPQQNEWGPHGGGGGDQSDKSHSAPSDSANQPKTRTNGAPRPTSDKPGPSSTRYPPNPCESSTKVPKLDGHNTYRSSDRGVVRSLQDDASGDWCVMNAQVVR